MNDREFLMWLHARLTEVHGESSLIDYMHKFRAVISSIPENQVTPNDGRGGNDLKSLRKKCAQQSVQSDGGQAMSLKESVEKLNALAHRFASNARRR